MATMSTTPASATPEVNTGVSPNAETSPAGLPEIPEYISGKFVLEYIAACDTTIQKRFEDLCARRRVEIPNTEDTLRTEQVELFMDAL